MKYLTATHSSNTTIDILNNQVEYHKNLFMFAIVLFELISSVLIIVASINEYEGSIEKYLQLHKHDGTNLLIPKNTTNSLFPPNDAPWGLKSEMIFQSRVIEIFSFA